MLQGAEQCCDHIALLGPAQAENLLVAEDGRVMLADFGATAKLEHARYSLPSFHLSDSSSSLSAASDGDGAVHSPGPSPDIRVEVGTSNTGLECHLGYPHPTYCAHTRQWFGLIPYCPHTALLRVTVSVSFVSYLARCLS